jgi:hypothetical protein
MTSTKENIKKAYENKMSRKEKIRRIESENERHVHYIFNPNVPCKITPFTRKYNRLLDGSLAEFETQEKEAFASYIHSMENEALNEEDKYPIVYENIPYFTLELTGLSRISFCVADDPFYKSARAKYYPEVYLISSKSEIRTLISPDKKVLEKY